MASPETVANCIALCSANYGGQRPESDTSTMASLWLLMFAEVPDPVLFAALRAHIADTEAGKWWPTVADLKARLPTDANDPAQIWSNIIARISGGRYSVRDLLTPDTERALDSIGGVWAIRHADGGEIASMRKRFIGTAKTKPPALRRLDGGLATALLTAFNKEKP